MEQISTRSAVQNKANEKNEADQAMTSCFLNSVVVMKIFENFSNPQLLRLSFVSKFWNYEARSVIRKRGNTIARLHHNGLRHDLQAFTISLRKMKIVPFSGIRIVCPDDNDEACECKTSALDLSNDVIVFDPLPFKSLSVKLARKRSSPGFHLAQKILQHLSEVLEDLTLEIPFAAEMFTTDYTQDCDFPCLRVLKLKETHSWQVTCEHYVNCVRVLTSRAPNLTEFHSYRPLRELLEVVKGSSVVPVCSYQVCAPFDEISDDVINSQLRLERIGLVCTGGHRFDFDRFNRITPMLLQSSSTRALHDLTVDAVLAVPLMYYGIQFENVRKLTLRVNFRELERSKPRVLTIIENFDFTRTFPNLNTVDIRKKEGSRIRKPLPVSLTTLIREASVSNSMLDRAVNIKELHSHDRALDNHSAKFFARMFPNIQQLYVESIGGRDASMFGLISEHWANLKEIHIQSNVLQNTANFDCVFCGIFFDELVQLMQQDEDYLKRVNIVPVRPSITCLRDLRVLNMSYDLDRRPEPIVYDETNPMFFFSKITGLIALARCPYLSVTLKISPDGAYAVNHLKPYVSTVL